MAAHLSISDSEGSSGTDDIMLQNDNKEDGNVWSECEEDEILIVKMERVTLIGKGR